MREAINVTPPEPGKTTVFIELECTDHAKAQWLFDQINGELLDRGEVTLTVANRRRKPLDCLETRGDT